MINIYLLSERKGDRMRARARSMQQKRPSAKVVWLLLIHLSLMPFEITHTDSRGVRLRFFSYLPPLLQGNAAFRNSLQSQIDINTERAIRPWGLIRPARQNEQNFW
jgi:hypothetical protein